MEKVKVLYKGSNVEEEGEEVNAWVFIDIKDHVSSYCTQFYESLERIETKRLENGISVKLWNGKREIQIWFDNAAACKLIKFSKELDQEC